MKFSCQQVVATATLVAASAASAVEGQAPTGFDWTVTSGNAVYTMGLDGRDVFSAGGAAVRAPVVIPFIPGLPNQGALNTAVFNSNTGQTGLSLSNGAGIDNAVSSMQASGSLLEFRRLVFNEDTDILVTRWNVFLTDWDIDLRTSTIYANLFSRVDSSVINNLGKVALFTATQPGFSEGTQGNIVLDQPYLDGDAVAHVSGRFNGLLRMNLSTSNLILTSLGLNTGNTDPLARLMREGDWGSVSFSANLRGTPSVPEPSSYALIGAGLLALWTTRRSSRKV